MPNSAHGNLYELNELLLPLRSLWVRIHVSSGFLVLGCVIHLGHTVFDRGIGKCPRVLKRRLPQGGERCSAMANLCCKFPDSLPWQQVSTDRLHVVRVCCRDLQTRHLPLV